jgi:hypothetical protein
MSRTAAVRIVLACFAVSLLAVGVWTLQAPGPRLVGGSEVCGAFLASLVGYAHQRRSSFAARLGAAVDRVAAREIARQRRTAAFARR